MCADAGVFQVLTGGAFGKVDIEFFGYVIGICCGSDLENNRHIHAFRHGFIGNEGIAVFCEDHAGRIAAITANRGNGLIARGDGLAVFIDKGDFDFAVFHHEKLRVWLRAGDDAAFVGASDFLGVLVGFFAVVVVIVSFVAFIFRKEKRSEECYGGEGYIGNFHIVLRWS